MTFCRSAKSLRPAQVQGAGVDSIPWHDQEHVSRDAPEGSQLQRSRSAPKEDSDSGGDGMEVAVMVVMVVA